MDYEALSQKMDTIFQDATGFDNRLKTGIYPRFLSKKRMESIKDRDPLICRAAGNLSVGFYVNLPEISTGHTSAMIVVTNSLAGRMNMTAEQIYRRSVKNLLPSCVIIPFNEMLGEIGLLPPEEITENIPVLYVSNKTRSNGAAAILCRDVKKKIAEILGDPFIVIPSSVHEVLCLACTDQNAESIISLSDMIRETNEAVVDPLDQLSNCAWLCKNGRLIPQQACCPEAI